MEGAFALLDADREDYGVFVSAGPFAGEVLDIRAEGDSCSDGLREV